MDEVIRYDVVVIHVAPDAFLVKCACSSGCSACGGAGKVLLKIRQEWIGHDDVGVVKCGCSGRSSCRACHGVGATVGLFPRVRCSNCGGTGLDSETRGRVTASYPCKTCRQIGSLWIGDLKSY